MVSNANGASEPDTKTITVYMTEDAHEQMLLPEATSTDTSNSATTANNEDCVYSLEDYVTEDNVNYAGTHVAGAMARKFLSWCQLWCHCEKRAKYFRYNKVEKMCWCLDVVCLLYTSPSPRDRG